jgi:hypothetical protein
MATCANSAQAVGMAAKFCFEKGLKPSELSNKEQIKQLQERLIYNGQYIPNVVVKDRENLMDQAKLTASSQLNLSEIPPNGPLLDLIHSAAQMLPLGEGKIPKLTFWTFAKAGSNALTCIFPKDRLATTPTPMVDCFMKSLLFVIF